MIRNTPPLPHIHVKTVKEASAVCRSFLDGVVIFNNSLSHFTKKKVKKKSLKVIRCSVIAMLEDYLEDLPRIGEAFMDVCS